MAASSGALYITCVEKQGAFLKVWGQIDKQLHSIIEKSLQQMTSQFDQGHFVPSLESIQVGILCCAKYKDGAYYRARITNTTMLQQNLVEVQFVDYGNREIISIISLRTIASFAPGLITIPPQARDFILANVTHHGVAWDNGTLALINSEMRYMDLQWVIVSQIGPHTLIKLYKNGEDLALSLFNRGMILSIASTAQHMILQNTGGASASPTYQISPPIQAVVAAQPVVPVASVVPTPPPALLTFKAVSLEPGTEGHVYISYVSDGPCHFSVQLQRLEDNLARLMKELNRMNLQPLEDDPLPGTVCVARCLEDDHICRAVVTSMVDSHYKVFYVDFGNTEVVPIDNLYQIPFKYVIPKVMAMRYALAGIDRSSVTLEMKCVFKDYVSDKLLRMKTLPPPTRSALPLCTLWDDGNNVNVLDILQQAALKAYPEPVQLSRGFSQEVRVSYVHSCSHFYVQVIVKEEELRKVMAELQLNCPKSDLLQPSQIKFGQPCCALFDADGQWYRAQILEQEGGSVKVRYVDYGNEELIAISNLRMPRGELLTALRPQALECCLNGYQNMADDLERDNILEELILEKEFTMKVIEMQGNRALVELNDSSRYNVGSLLLERLASAHSQVSPLLIQDSHHIEQRKRSCPNAAAGNSQAYRLERRQSRDQNDKASSPKQSLNDRGWSPKQASNDKGFTSPKQFSNDKGWSNSKQNSEEGAWNNNRQDSWRQTKSPSRKEDGGDSSDQGRGKRDRFNKKESWGGGDSNWKKGAKSPNQKEGNEKSWAEGTEKNWRRSDSRSDSQNDDKRPKRKFTAGDRSGSWKSSGQDNNWSNDTNVAKVVDPAPSTATFLSSDLTGKCENVIITWFRDPGYFYCQLQESRVEFRKLMDEIQNTYCKIKPESVLVGAPAIALFQEDSVRYRARVLEVQGTQYRVQFVDYGNISTTNTVWPIENKFMQLPAQAVSCGLNGLVPLESGWPNSDTYFDKESFTCTFIASENDKFLVDLTCDNQNVSETLVAAGLASFGGCNIQDNFDPSLLLGQQLRVTLGEVQSLDSFYVQLQNETYVLCTMHNLQSATETFEDTLKQCVGSIVIMYVDNVLEEKTEVTLYDTTATKLKIVEPDEGAYETVPLPCPLPVLYPTLHGWISFLAAADNDKHRLFIQPSEFSDTLAQLLDDLFNHYNSTVLDAPIQPEVGSLCAAHSADGNWYRALVGSVENESITVTFIDYGNSESVPNAELRELSQEFMKQHILALEVLASGIDESFSEQEVTANLWYGDGGWEGEILKVAEATLPQQNEPEVEEPTVAAVVEQPTDSSQEQMVPGATEPSAEQQSEPPIQLGVTVILSHVDSPSEFYLQLSKDVETIDSLQATLQEQVKSFPDLENPTAGVLCAAPYSLDQQWYRAQVLDADSDITTVRFVDFGNTDVLSNDTTHVKTLPPDLLSLEQHARRCSLIIKSSDAEWSPAACERFEQLTNFEHLTAEIIHQDEKTTYVELYASALSIAESLLREGLATKLQLETESSCSGYVSHLNSPSEFWVQLENSVADLEWIAEQLSTAENFPELEDLTPGSLCAALFPEDEMWYRARILSNTVAGLEVLFIDYGNSCTCSGLRQLPEDLIMLPALAQKCSLQKPPGILQWSTESTEVFKSISADGASIFSIDKLSTGETTVVKLLLDGKDITAELLAKTQDAYITHYESISSFWLQKAEDASKLDVITEKLTEALEWAKYEPTDGNNDLVAALFAEDEKWYRAKIIGEQDSQYEVLFVDFGNAATTKEVRVLPYDIEKESPLATKYKLDALPGCRWNDESSKQLAVISNEGTTAFQVEFVAGDIVRLYINGNDIRTDLDSTSVSSLQSTPKRSSALKTDNIIPQDIENFLDNELLTLNDARTVEVPKEHADQEDTQHEEAEQISTANAESPNESAASTEVGLHLSSVVNMKELVEEIVRSSDMSSNGINESSEQTSDDAHEVEEIKMNVGLDSLKDLNASFAAGDGVASESDKSIDTTETSDVADISSNLGAGDGKVTLSTNQQSDDVVELNEASKLTAEDDIILSTNQLSMAHKQTKNIGDNEVNLKDELAMLAKTQSNIETNESSVGSVTELSAEEHANLSTNEPSIANEQTKKTEETIIEDTEVSLEDDLATVANVQANIDTKEGDLESETELSAEEPVILSTNQPSIANEPTKKTEETIIEDSEVSLEDNLATVANTQANVETKESSLGSVTELSAEEHATLSTNEPSIANEQTKKTEETIIEDSEVSLEDNLATVANVQANIDTKDGDLESETELSAEEPVILSTNQPSIVNEPTKKMEETIIEDSEVSLQDELAMVAKIQAKIETNDSSLEHITELSAEEDASFKSPVDFTQRRSSTPHCEKIVPGSVCRGDLTECGQTEDKYGNDSILSENVSESEDNENSQYMTPVAKTAIEDVSQISSSISSCKVALDERIVPGCISRGETPEPPENNTDKTLLGAVNGIEIKDNAMT